MIEYYLFFKAFHIIGFVAWFAGLFYLVRMFVYHSEAKDQEEAMVMPWQKQFSLMQTRVYKIISTPAMVITWLFGLSMLIANPAILSQNWIKVKLVLLVLLTIYHFYCKTIMKRQAALKDNFTSFQYRLLNELPTLFLVSIVLLAVAKDILNFAKLFGGVILFGISLYMAAKLYKKVRNN